MGRGCRKYDAESGCAKHPGDAAAAAAAEERKSSDDAAPLGASSPRPAPPLTPLLLPPQLPVSQLPLPLLPPPPDASPARDGRAGGASLQAASRSSAALPEPEAAVLLPPCSEGSLPTFCLSRCLRFW